MFIGYFFLKIVLTYKIYLCRPTLNTCHVYTFYFFSQLLNSSKCFEFQVLFVIFNDMIMIILCWFSALFIVCFSVHVLFIFKFRIKYNYYKGKQFLFSLRINLCACFCPNVDLKLYNITSVYYLKIPYFSRWFEWY